MPALAAYVRRATALAVGVAAAGVGYAAGYERQAFTLRRFTVPVLAPGAQPLRILHLSDLHLTPGQRHKQAWVRSLAELEPDLVVDTGDNIAHPGAVDALVAALDGLLDRPGVFVMGSNDYFAPRPFNPARYLVGPSHRQPGRPEELPHGRLRTTLGERGWVDLDNRRTVLAVDGRSVELVVVDDPHIGRDRYAHVAAPARGDVALTIGVTHAPYRRVLDAMAADGARLLLAGHTHGGQLCLPGIGALITNCDLPPRQAKGLWPYADGSWMHVSAGLGTSPYAPVRFACRPEASLLTMVPRSDASAVTAAR